MIDPGKLRYVTDCEGHRTDVIVPIEEFEKLILEFEDVLDQVECAAMLLRPSDEPELPLRDLLDRIEDEYYSKLLDEREGESALEWERLCHQLIAEGHLKPDAPPATNTGL